MEWLQTIHLLLLLLLLLIIFFFVFLITLVIIIAPLLPFGTLSQSAQTRPNHIPLFLIVAPWQVDPLRSLAKSKPEFGAFRVYPPEFSAPQNECPDGKIVTDDSARVERWGSCWNR